MKQVYKEMIIIFGISILVILVLLLMAGGMIYMFKYLAGY